MQQNQDQLKNDRIAEYMGMMWGMYPKFGAEDKMLGLRIPLYQKVLARFTLGQIEYSFQQWMATGKEFPLPAHLVEIIQPPKEKLSPVYYMELKKFQKGGGYIWEDEKLQFIKDFEAQEMGKMPSSQVAKIKQDIENYRLQHQKDFSNEL